MVEPLQQGDLFWIDSISPSLLEMGGRHPVVVVQGNRLNKSRIRTVIVCPVTSNVDRANDVGNVLLEQGEGGLTKRSVVNISQFYTLDKERLAEYVGTLSLSRVQQIVAGISLTFAVEISKIDAKD